MADQIEVRNFEMRADASTGPRQLRGLAAVFNTPMKYRDFFGDVEERIAEGAFSASLKADKQLMNWNHNPDIILASTANETLRLTEEKDGLAFEADLADTQWGRDAHELVRSGTVGEMSFGFIVRKQEFDESDPKVLKRTIQEVRLIEVSPVGFAAYPTTSVEANAGKAVAEYRAAHPGTQPIPDPTPEPADPKTDGTRDRIEKKILAQKLKEG